MRRTRLLLAIPASRRGKRVWKSGVGGTTTKREGETQTRFYCFAQTRDLSLLLGRGSPFECVRDGSITADRIKKKIIIILERAVFSRRMGGGQALKRIPRIRFPQRHPNVSSSGSTSQSPAAATNKDAQNVFMSGSDVPAPPLNTAVGGKVSLQPKRTPVSEREIEAILLGGCF